MGYRTALVVFALTGASAGAGDLEDFLPQTRVISTAVQISDGSIEADTHQLTIECSDPDLSVGGCCLFNDPPCPSTYQYRAGDTTAVSTYWNEVVDCDSQDCSNYQAIWSLAMGNPSSGSKLFLFQNEPIDFGDVSDFDGAEVTFCVFSGLTLPVRSQGLVCNNGFFVETPVDPYDGPFFHPEGFAVTSPTACTPYGS